MLLNTRAHETITFGGSKALLPTFGLSPITPGDVDGNVLVYNLVKEYCEELFRYDDLIERVSHGRVDPYWFYKLPEAAELFEFWRDGIVTIETVGFGVDAMNGTATLGLMMIMHDVGFGDRLKQQIRANWEVAQAVARDDDPVEFIDISDYRLERYLREDRYHFGAAFTLSLALKRMLQRATLRSQL